MPDAQRRDKLPLMNGPTANSWPSTTTIRRRQGAEGRGQKKIERKKEREFLARLCLSLALSPNLIKFFPRFLSPSLCPYNLPYPTKLEIPQIRDNPSVIIMQFGKFSQT